MLHPQVRSHRCVVTGVLSQVFSHKVCSHKVCSHKVCSHKCDSKKFEGLHMGCNCYVEAVLVFLLCMVLCAFMPACLSVCLSRCLCASVCLFAQDVCLTLQTTSIPSIF